MFTTKALKAACIKAFFIVMIGLAALIAGLLLIARLESGLSDQLLGCEQHFLDLEGRVKTHDVSFAGRLLISRLFELEPVSSSPVVALDRILSACPWLGGLWKSRRNLQRCELMVRGLEEELENTESKLGIFQFIKTLISKKVDYLWMHSGLCLTLAGGLMATLLPGRKRKTKLEDENQEEETEWWSMDSSLDGTVVTEDLEGQNVRVKPSDAKEKLKDIEKITGQANELLKEKTGYIEAQMKRLINVTKKVEAVEKDREAEKEKATQIMDDLQQINKLQKADIERLSLQIEAAQNDGKEEIEKLTKTIDNLRATNRQLEADAALILDDFAAFQNDREVEKEDANRIISELYGKNDQLQKEVDNKKASVEEHRKAREEMEISIRLLKEELNGPKKKTRAQTEKISQLLQEKEELKGNVEEMSKERNKLNGQLMEAQINDLVRRKRYDALVSEVEGFKNQVIILENDLTTALEENRTTQEEKLRLNEEKDNLQKQVELLNHEKDKLENKPQIQNTILLPSKEASHRSVEGSQKPKEESPRKQKAERKLITFDLDSDKPQKDDANLLPSKEESPGSVEGSQKAKQESPPRKQKTQHKLITFDLDSDEPQKDDAILLPFKGASHRSVEGSQKPKKESPPRKQKTERKLITFDLDSDEPKIQNPSYFTSKEASTRIVESRQKPKKEPPPRKQKAERTLITYDVDSDERRIQKTIFLPSKEAFDLPGQRQEGDHILFNGEKVKFTWLAEIKQALVELDIPRNFHRAINGTHGRTVETIMAESGVTLIEMPDRFEKSNLVTISGGIQQVQLAARKIEKLISKLY
ncbi:liprin-beta-1-like [Macrobrachium nipponense]|uniref:liprin-beta-1-like n=1 Tax=Macrobrachium nipponense TaxID=159736 RepID=UPI0030C80C8B